jgi:Cu2+-exporting ATPase
VAKEAGSKHPAHHADHADMAADFRKRFWISLIVTLPILALSPMFQWGVLLTPALGAVFMSASTVIVAINARLLRLKQPPSTSSMGGAA